MSPLGEPQAQVLMYGDSSDCTDTKMWAGTKPGIWTGGGSSFLLSSLLVSIGSDLDPQKSRHKDMVTIAEKPCRRILNKGGSLIGLVAIALPLTRATNQQMQVAANKCHLNHESRH